MARTKGGIAARAAPFGGHGRSTAARIRGVSGLDRARGGTLTRDIPKSVKDKVDAYVYLRDGHRCTRCHRSADEVQMTVAHIIAHAEETRRISVTNETGCYPPPRIRTTNRADALKPSRTGS